MGSFTFPAPSVQHINGSPQERGIPSHPNYASNQGQKFNFTAKGDNKQENFSRENAEGGLLLAVGLLSVAVLVFGTQSLFVEKLKDT